MTPTYIPTTTQSKTTSARVALCSPSKKKPDLVRGTHLTIVDCHTYYLRRNKDKDYAFEHYKWYINSFIPRHCEDRSLVFIAPDFDWLNETERFHLVVDFFYWQSFKNAKFLVMPSEQSAQYVNNVVGHCLRPNMTGPVHPIWTHTFSRPHVRLDGETKMWTYDSITPVDTHYYDK